MSTQLKRPLLILSGIIVTAILLVVVGYQLYTSTAVSAADPAKSEAKVAAILERQNQANSEMQPEDLIKSYIEAFAYESGLPEQSPTRFMLYVSYGSWLSDVGDHEGALQFFQRAEQIHKLPGFFGDDHPPYLQIGTEYYHLENMDSAEYYFKEILNFEALSLVPASIYNNIGVLYTWANREAEAEQYFKQALEVQENKSSGFAIKMYLNLAESLMKQDKLEETRQLHQIIEQSEHIHTQSPNRFLYLCYRAMYAFKVEQASFEECESYFSEARALLAELPILRARHVQFKQDLLNVQIAYYLQSEQFAKAYATQVELSESVEQEHSRDKYFLSKTMQFVRIAEQKNASNELEIETLKAAQSSTFLKIWIAFSIVLMTFILIIGLRRVRGHRLALAESDLQKAAAVENAERKEEEVQVKRKELNKLSTHVSKYSDWTVDFKKQLTEIHRIGDVSKKSEQLTGLIVDFKNKINDREITQILLGNLEGTDLGFTDRIKSAHPILTENELDLCGLIRMDLKNGEIAALKNITVGSVKTLKSRLKKKIIPDSSQDLKSFLSSI